MEDQRVYFGKYAAPLNGNWKQNFLDEGLLYLPFCAALPWKLLFLERAHVLSCLEIAPLESQASRAVCSQGYSNYEWSEKREVVSYKSRGFDFEHILHVRERSKYDFI